MRFLPQAHTSPKLLKYQSIFQGKEFCHLWRWVGKTAVAYDSLVWVEEELNVLRLQLKDVTRPQLHLQILT